MCERALHVRKLAPGDRAVWVELYRGYAAFYRREFTAGVEERLWNWLMDGAHEMEGIVCECGGEIFGFAHFRRMPSPLRAADVGFLDDLFVAPHARRRGVAAALLGEVQNIAARRGWAVVRWLTAKDNRGARDLYERFAECSDWRVYEMRPREK